MERLFAARMRQALADALRCQQILASLGPWRKARRAIRRSLGSLQPITGIEVTGLPPAFVVDVGLIESRGWAVVEFNPAWCSGLLGADPAAVLGVLEQSCQDVECLEASCASWIVRRRNPKRPR